jgi:hypothetical protein
LIKRLLFAPQSYCTFSATWAKNPYQAFPHLHSEFQ